MIIQTKTGVQITGEIRSDPEVRSAGQKEVLKFDLKASSTKGPDGKWQSFFVGVNAWHGIAERDGMYQKGDVVTVTARELKSREYNGKTYHNVDADSIVPDDLVLLRWMQQMIDMMAQPAPPPELEPWAYVRRALAEAEAQGCKSVEEYRLTNPIGAGRNMRVDRIRPSGNDILANATRRRALFKPEAVADGLEQNLRRLKKKEAAKEGAPDVPEP